MAIDQKQSVRRLLEEGFGKGNFAIFDEICDPAYKGHDPVAGEMDLERAKESCRGYKTAFPDLKPTILSSHQDGDTVVTHWRMTGQHQKALMGIEPTGQRVTVEGISLARFRAGKLAEDWVQWDVLGMLRQLGVASGAEAGSTPRQRTQPHA
jgi:predicted ester cyclase